jgi:hypothetical protein
MTLTFPKWGLGSPPGLPKLQSWIAGVKTPRIGVFFISLENYESVDVKKWARMGHLDICSTSYVQKKGRESNWQFDSRPLKVRNRSDPGVFRGNATHRWKALKESYKFASHLVPIGGLRKELWPCEILRVQTGTILRQFRDSTLGVPGQKPFRCGCGGVTQRILYGGRWWLPPSPGRGESSESILPVACPNIESVSEGVLTNLLVGFDAGLSN